MAFSLAICSGELSVRTISWVSGTSCTAAPRALTILVVSAVSSPHLAIRSEAAVARFPKSSTDLAASRSQSLTLRSEPQRCNASPMPVSPKAEKNPPIPLDAVLMPSTKRAMNRSPLPRPRAIEPAMEVNPVPTAAANRMISGWCSLMNPATLSMPTVIWPRASVPLPRNGEMNASPRRPSAAPMFLTEPSNVPPIFLAAPPTFSAMTFWNVAAST